MTMWDLSMNGLIRIAKLMNSFQPFLIVIWFGLGGSFLVLTRLWRCSTSHR